MPGELSYKVLFAYGTGHVLNDLCASMWFTYLLIFFLYVLEFGNTLSGAALFIGQIADGISTPIIGLVSDDQRWSCSYGRRKTWHLIGTLCVLFGFTFIFSPCYGCQKWSHSQQLAYFTIFIILFQFGWAATQVSHLSIAIDLTPDVHTRTSLYTIRYFFTVVSNIFVYSITWYIFHFNRTDDDSIIGPKDIHKLQKVAYIVVIVGAVSSLLFHLMIKEPQPSSRHSAESANLIPSEAVSRGVLLQNSKIYNVACIYVATRLFVNLSQIYIPLYLRDYLFLPTESLAVLPLVMFLSSLVTTAVIKPFNMAFGRKVTYGIGALFGIGGCLWMQVGSDFYYKYYEIFGVVSVFGLASSILLVTSQGVTADLIGLDTDNAAFLTGIMSFADKLSNGLAVMIIQYFKCLTGCSTFTRDVILYGCGGSALFGLFWIGILHLNSTPREDEAITSAEDTQDEGEDNSNSKTDSLGETTE